MCYIRKHSSLAHSVILGSQNAFDLRNKKTFSKTPFYIGKIESHLLEVQDIKTIHIVRKSELVSDVHITS